MQEQICICELVPSIRSRCRWVFVLHDLERYKTTNTGYLAWRSIADAQLCWYRSRVEPTIPPVELPEERETWLLFPGRGEPVPAADLLTRDKPLTIVIPDGTWSQTRKIVRTRPEFADLPCISLPEEAHARWSLRQETLESGMSTVDAVCWLMAALEGPEASAPLERVAEEMWRRTMTSRGTPPPE
jgi:DTW domain-containing protein YfiP